MVSQLGLGHALLLAQLRYALADVDAGALVDAELLKPIVYGKLAVVPSPLFAGIVDPCGSVEVNLYRFLGQKIRYFSVLCHNHDAAFIVLPPRLEIKLAAKIYLIR